MPLVIFIGNNINAMKYIKEFNTHQEYEEYIGSQGKVLPNVSYCDDVSDVHYNPGEKPTEDGLITVVYEVESTSEPTRLWNIENRQHVTGMTVDGETMSELVGEYTFATTGEHTVVYSTDDGTSVDLAMFEDCYTIVRAALGNGITSTSRDLFQGCFRLESVQLPETLTAIEMNTFMDNASLYQITLPESLITIGQMAFFMCAVMDEITIPKNVTQIGGSCFISCELLQRVNVMAPTPPQIDWTFVENTQYDVYVPEQYITEYQEADWWRDLEDRLIPIT